ncbi:MAG TPA: glycosyltransferase [Verrucomicrobiae bacterium]|nr:glycosyltransferase [Verrucomicrobiae bacterium]
MKKVPMDGTSHVAMTGSASRYPSPTVAYIFEIHPVLSQTPLEREVAGLMAQGLTVTVHSLLRTKLKTPNAPADIDRSRVDYFRWWEAARLVVALPREWRRDPALLRDGWRILWRHRPTGFVNSLVNLWAAIFAVCRAKQFRTSGVQHVHGAWATGPATAAAILGRLCGIPFSFAAHAYDIYEGGGDQFLEPKLRAASFVRTITEANRAYLQQRAPEANILLVRMGLQQLPPLAPRGPAPQAIRLLSVARLVPKKGLVHQLAACRLLKQWGLHPEARIVGDGELKRRLQRQIDRWALTGVVTLCGELEQEQVQEAYRWADIFWHTGVVDARGNRDGLPNVIPEAFAHQLPVICCREPGPTEAVTDGVTGLVVDVTDRAALAGAVRRLVGDEPLRRRFGENGRRWVEENFLARENMAVLAQAFRETTLPHQRRAELAAEAESALAARRLVGSAPGVKAPPIIAYILMKYPSWSQTFLEREIAGLMRQGLRVEVHSLWRARPEAPPSTEAGAGPAGQDLTVHYFHWWEAAQLVVALPRELRRDRNLLRDGRQLVARYGQTGRTDFLKNLWGAIFAVCRARQFRDHRVRLVHGAWAASPATAAAVLGRLCRIPFSFGAQAYDIYEQGGDQFLEPKLRAASFVHTTTQSNVAYLRQRVPQARLVMARRGLDRLPPDVERSGTPGPIRILSVARLAPIKGHQHQLAACAVLKKWNVPFVARIIGDGELKPELEQQINVLGLVDSVTLCGGQRQEQVHQAYEWADIFWHTGVVDARGNRDGLPNVIPEAFAHQLPVICCRARGATEAVADGVTGLVVDVTDPVALATAVRRLIENEPLRRRLGKNGRRWVEENFLIGDNVAILAEAFREAMGAPVCAAAVETSAVAALRS